MTPILYTGEEDIYRPGIVRTICDPACGTGGMLSISEKYNREQNPQARLELFGQDPLQRYAHAQQHSGICATYTWLRVGAVVPTPPPMVPTRDNHSSLTES